MNGSKTIFSQIIFVDYFYQLRYYLEILKIHLCLYIGLSAVFGHVMAKNDFSYDSFILGLFVFILSCGSAVLNNIQDREYDSFFPRTWNRSLPRKRVSIFHAGLIATVLICSGLSGVLFVQGFPPFFWGVMAVICYNALYTPLKKRSLLAIIPGSLSGMLPVLIGWTAAGNTVLDPGILIIMSVFGLWQIPHFFILILKTRQVYPVTPAQNRFPCFFRMFCENEIKLQILIWISLYSLAILLFLMNGFINNYVLLTASGMHAIGITFLLLIMMFKIRQQNISFVFIAINLSMLLFMGAGIFDKSL